MQPLNHDMDDLMRQAAEGYPVRPTGADWDKVAQQLEAAEAPATAAGRYGGLKKLLFLLPFLLAGFVCDRFVTLQYGHLKNLEAAASHATATPKAAVSDPANEAQPTTAAPTHDVRVLLPAKTSASRLLTAAPQRQYARTETESPGTIVFDKQPVDENGKAVLTNDIAVATRVMHADPVAKQGQYELPVPNLEKTQRIVLLAKNIPVTVSKKQPAAQTEKFYVSLLMGPDFSRVKEQKVNPAGYSIGLMAGYRFANRWRVEGGVVWDKKNYYSTGEYFKTNHLNLPQHAQVMLVDGYCAMFDVPLNIRFDAVQRSRNTFFVSAGASTYFMQKEDYDYVYRRYNVDYAGNAVYKRETTNWFAIANLNLGYEHRFGAKTKLHVEPYLRMPVNGVGIGSLPLRSGGILVGMTYTFK